MKKQILLSVLCIILSVFLVACGTNQINSDQNTSNLMEETKEETNDTVAEKEQDDFFVTYPMVITDQAGREVTIANKPEKLVSVYYITTSALLALDLKSEIVGVESNPEKRPLYGLCAPELFEVTQVGSPKELDFEVCASIQPDLVILPMRAKDMAESLEKLDIPVMIVNPEGSDELMEMLTLIGQATGQVERAKELTGYITEKTNSLTTALAECDAKTVYLGGNSSFFSTASKGMYQNDLITLAGGKNVAGKIDDTYWVESSYEQLLTWNPEVIAMASDASYSVQEILADSNLQACQAIVNQAVIQIPSNIEAWDSPVPGSFLGAYYLASNIHPDVILDEQYKAMVKEFYEKFYGFIAEE